MRRIHIGAGSNLGDRRQYLEKAKSALQCISEIVWVGQSRTYETDPVGGPKQGRYLNAVWMIETQLDANTIFEYLMSIERSLGRIREVPNGPRTIDLDLLTFGSEIIEKQGLTVPHRRMHERDFVLRPFADIDPDWIHPRLNLSVCQMREALFAHH